MSSDLSEKLAQVVICFGVFIYRYLFIYIKVLSKDFVS